MKLTKGKINRIMNKKKNSKNIKKRKYKRTNTCNNKAKRHLANRTLKCYKSKKLNKKKISQTGYDKPSGYRYALKRQKGGGGFDRYKIDQKIINNTKYWLNTQHEIYKELHDIGVLDNEKGIWNKKIRRESFAELNNSDGKMPALMKYKQYIKDQKFDARNIKNAEDANKDAKDKDNTNKIQEGIIKKLKKDKEMESKSRNNCTDLSITLLKITPEIINQITKKGYITIEMTSNYEENAKFNIRLPKFSLRVGHYLVVEPPNADTERLAFAEKMKDDRIKKLERKIEKSKTKGLCSILMGDFGMLSSKICNKAGKLADDDNDDDTEDDNDDDTEDDNDDEY